MHVASCLVSPKFEAVAKAKWNSDKRYSYVHELIAYVSTDAVMLPLASAGFGPIFAYEAEVDRGAA